VRLGRAVALSTRRLAGQPWFRAVPVRYAGTPHLSAHAATMAGRYNGGTPAYPAHEVLYLCDDRMVCLFEVGGLVGRPHVGGPLAVAPGGVGGWASVSVRVSLRRVADLTRAAERRLIGTTCQELSGDWQGYRRRRPFAAYGPPYHTPVPTQRLGAALYAVPGLEGFLVHSAQVGDHTNLIVFPAKLDPASRLEFFDDRGALIASRP
jgi:RES domain-containing protein